MEVQNTVLNYLSLDLQVFSSQ